MDRDKPGAADAATTVAQTDSLLYRGLAIRRFGYPARLADCQSAKQQVTNLRYSGTQSKSFFFAKLQNCITDGKMQVGRVTPCAPPFVFKRAAGRGLPAPPSQLSVCIRVHPWLK